MPQTKIIVLDDDPTGSQTVHGCLLLTRWDPVTLSEALQDPSPLFFILTNTRGMDAGRAADLTRNVCTNLRSALDGLAAAARRSSPCWSVVPTRRCAATIRWRPTSSPRNWVPSMPTSWCPPFSRAVG